MLSSHTLCDPGVLCKFFLFIILLFYFLPEKVDFAFWDRPIYCNRSQNLGMFHMVEWGVGGGLIDFVDDSCAVFFGFHESLV